jgi:hypothetical protein
VLVTSIVRRVLTPDGKIKPDSPVPFERAPSRYPEEGEAPMTIEIHRPELEALIIQRMKSGGFDNVEDALIQALKTPLPSEELAKTRDKRTGADLIAALQASPHRELDIEPSKVRLTVVRDVVL